MYEGSITLHVKPDVWEIEKLHKIIRHFGELHEVPGRALYAINLAVDELVTNVILYGFDEPAGQEIVVRVEAVKTEVRAVVIDGGKAFDPRSVPHPDLGASLEERSLGGLGIHLVRSLMDTLNYRREDGKNVLTLTKRIR